MTYFYIPCQIIAKLFLRLGFKMTATAGYTMLYNNIKKNRKL